LEPLNRFFAANVVSDAERIAKIPVLSSTGAADVNVKRFLFDIHNECLHCSPRFLLVGSGQKPALHAAHFRLAFSLRPRCFRFIGWGGVLDSARPPPGTPVR
jgi:hypothetical protein